MQVKGVLIAAVCLIAMVQAAPQEPIGLAGGTQQRILPGLLGGGGLGGGRGILGLFTNLLGLGGQTGGFGGYPLPPPFGLYNGYGGGYGYGYPPYGGGFGGFGAPPPFFG